MGESCDGDCGARQGGVGARGLGGGHRRVEFLRVASTPCCWVVANLAVEERVVPDGGARGSRSGSGGIDVC